MSLEIVELRREGEVGPFLDFAHQVYRGTPWVPPLRLHLRLMMGRLRGPERRFYLALRDGRPVARLGAAVHRYPGYEALHFGFFECLPGEPEAAQRLVDRAHRLAPLLPLRGPYHFRQEDFYTGLLVDGFDDPPAFGTSYNPPYYQGYLGQAGLTPAIQTFTYLGERAQYRPELLRSRAERARAEGVKVRSLRPRQRLRDVKAAVSVMNAALRGSWNFEPIGTQQTWELLLLSYLFLDPRWLLLAEREGRTVGTAILLPDCNPWLAETGGRLTIRLLSRLLRRAPGLERIRAWAMGILPGERGTYVAAALADAILRDLVGGTSFERLEVSWVLESNGPMNALLRALGARRSRTHEILEKPPL